MASSLKVATFTVQADARQSARWKQAAHGEGYASTGAWLAVAADGYLKARARAGNPIPLALTKARFHVELQNGPAELPGFVSMPFAAFRGTAAGPKVRCSHYFTLVYKPTGRILATTRSLMQCKALAAELARFWVRGDGSEPSIDPGPTIPSHFA